MKSGKIFRIIYLALFLAVLHINPVSSQRTDIGIGVGGLLYWGDLTPVKITESFENLRFGVQAFYRTEVSSVLSARINFMVGGLNGDDLTSSDESRASRNLRFDSRIVEASLMGEFSFLKFDLPQQDEGLSFYASAGISVLYFDPKTKYQGVTYSLQELGTEGQSMAGFPDKYSKVSFGAILGGGMKIILSDQLTLNPEIGVRITFTDYIDDVSGSYVNYFELLNGNGPIAAALGNRTGEYFGLSEPVIVDTGAKRGGSANDYYFLGMINITYRLSDSASIFAKRGKKYNSECPTF